MTVLAFCYRYHLNLAVSQANYLSCLVGNCIFNVFCNGLLFAFLVGKTYFDWHNMFTRFSPIDLMLQITINPANFIIAKGRHPILINPDIILKLT